MASSSQDPAYTPKLLDLCGPANYSVDAEPMYRRLSSVSDRVMSHKGQSRAIPIVDPVSGEALSCTPPNTSVIEALRESADTGPSLSTSSGSRGPIGRSSPPAMLQDLRLILSGSSQESLFSFTTFLPTSESNHAPVPVSPTDYTLPSSPPAHLNCFNWQRSHGTLVATLHFVLGNPNQIRLIWFA